MGNHIAAYSKDTKLHRKVLALSLYAMGSFSIFHSCIELALLNLQKWPSIVGITVGICILVIAQFLAPKVSAQKNFSVLLFFGIPIFCIRLWTMDGFNGSSANWLIIAPILAYMFGSKKDFIGWGILSAAAYFVSMLAQYYYPFHNYSNYPAALSVSLTLLSFTVLAIHIFLIFYLKAGIEKELGQLRLRNQNISKLASIGKIAGNLAHELNTPFTTIIFLNQKMKKALGSNMSLEVSKIIDQQNQVIKNTSESISILLSAIETSTSNKFGAVIASEIIKDVEALMRNDIKFNNFKLINKIHLKEPSAEFISSQGLVTQAVVLLLNYLVHKRANRLIDDNIIEVIYSHNRNAFEIHIQNTQKKIVTDGNILVLNKVEDTVDSARAIINDLGGEFSFKENSKNIEFKINFIIEQNSRRNIKEASGG